MEEKNIREIRTTDKSDGMEREGMEFSNFETSRKKVFWERRGESTRQIYENGKKVGKKVDDEISS